MSATRPVGAARPSAGAFLTEETPVDVIERVLTRVTRRANLPKIHERLCRRAGVSLDRALYTTLTRIAEHAPVRLSDLATSLGVDTSTASRQVSALEKASLVLRVADPTDGRAALIETSDEGMALLLRMRDARRQGMADLLEPWSEEDRRTLAQLLTRLSDDLVRYAEQAPEEPAPRG